MGRKNELNFIKYLEAKKSVEWWYKNGNFGSEHFSIAYYDNEAKKECLFYSDWIVKLKDKFLILDTKQGMTVDSRDTKYKAESLHSAWVFEKIRLSVELLRMFLMFGESITKKNITMIPILKIGGI